MLTRSLTKADYDQIVRVIDQWWEGPTSALAHPMFFYELGEEARVVEIDDGTLVGFMLAFRAKPHDSEIGYVHLIGIHPEHRRKGVARLLYAKFEEACRARGCSALKAITTHGNEGSVRFHAALGFKVSNVEDYAGPGRARIVFQKGL